MVGTAVRRVEGVLHRQLLLLFSRSLPAMHLSLNDDIQTILSRLAAISAISTCQGSTPHAIKYELHDLGALGADSETAIQSLTLLYSVPDPQTFVGRGCTELGPMRSDTVKCADRFLNHWFIGLHRKSRAFKKSMASPRVQGGSTVFFG